MNKLIIGIAVILLVAGGWFLFNSNTVSYVAVVNDEVTQLEAELKALEAGLAAGTVTPDQALEARAKIVARMDAINTAVNTADGKTLTAAQRAQLVAGLGRLKAALGNYAATLDNLDTIAETASAEAKAKYRGNPRKVSSVIVETIATVEAQAEEVIENFEPSTTDELEDLAEATSTSDMMGDESDMEESEADEAGSSDGDESGEEATDENTEDASTDETDAGTDEGIEVDVETEAEAEASTTTEDPISN